MIEQQKFALLFPGQGSQKKGMGYELAKRSSVASRTFEEADRVCRDLNLGFLVTEVCFDDPKGQLEGDSADTSVIQPCLLTVCVAVVRHLKEQGVPPADIHLGHSTGKYSALVASDSLDLSTGIEFVSQRGIVMKEAKDDLGTIVGLVRGLDHPKIKEVLLDLTERVGLQDTDLRPALTVVNSRVQSMIVVPAHLWDRASEALRSAGAKVNSYKNAPPSHYYGLAEAQERLNRFRLSLKRPNVPILDDLTNNILERVEDIEVSVSRHLIAPIFWRANLNFLEREGIVYAIEVGPGKVLQGIAAQEYPGLHVDTTDTMESIENICAGYVPIG